MTDPQPNPKQRLLRNAPAAPGSALPSDAAATTHAQLPHRQSR